jgi:hypothetical protein
MKGLLRAEHYQVADRIIEIITELDYEVEVQREILWFMVKLYGRPSRLRKPKGERPKDPPPDSPGGSFSDAYVGVFWLEDLACAA